MQGPDHVGGIEQCSSYVVVGAPFDCRSGGLQVGTASPAVRLGGMPTSSRISRIVMTARSRRLRFSVAVRLST